MVALERSSSSAERKGKPGTKKKESVCPLCRAETRVVPGGGYADGDVFSV